MLQILANNGAGLWVVVASVVAALLFCAWLGRHSRTKHIGTVCVGIDGTVLVPLAGGLVTVAVPNPLVPVQGDHGDLLLLPEYREEGVRLFVSASLVRQDLDDEDSAAFAVRQWAEANDTEPEDRDGYVVACAVEHVEHAGREFELHRWIVGKELAVVMLMVEIDQRKAKSSSIKRMLKRVPGLIKRLQINVQRHTLAIEANETDYLTYESKSLIVRSINKHDHAFLERWEANGQKLLARYLAPTLLENITPMTLDWAHTLWQRDPDESKPEAGELAKALGVAFGNYCVRSLELRWGATEVCGVRHMVLRHGLSRVVVFPLEAASSSGPSSEPFRALFNVIQHMVDQGAQKSAA